MPNAPIGETTTLKDARGGHSPPLKDFNANIVIFSHIQPNDKNDQVLIILIKSN